MRRKRLIYFTFIALFAAIMSVRTMAQTFPSDTPPQNGGGPDGNNGPNGGRNQGGPPPLGFHLLPPFVMDKLDLTDEQQEQVDQLEKDTAAKLSKILTPQQWKTLQTTRPPRRGGGDRGGPGDNGPGNGGPGEGPGPGGPGGGGQGGNQGPPN